MSGLLLSRLVNFSLVNHSWLLCLLGTPCTPSLIHRDQDTAWAGARSGKHWEERAKGFGRALWPLRAAARCDESPLREVMGRARRRRGCSGAHSRVLPTAMLVSTLGIQLSSPLLHSPACRQGVERRCSWVSAGGAGIAPCSPMSDVERAGGESRTSPTSPSCCMSGSGGPQKPHADCRGCQPPSPTSTPSAPVRWRPHSHQCSCPAGHPS